MSTAAHDQAQLIEALRRARYDGGGDPHLIVRLAAELKAASPHGEFLPALRAAWPDDLQPAKYLSRKRRQAESDLAKPPSDEPATILAQDEAALYDDLAPLLGVPAANRGHLLRCLAADRGLSEATLAKILRAMGELRAQGKDASAALHQESRADKGLSRKLRNHPAAANRFAQLCMGTSPDLGLSTKHWNTSLAIRQIKKEFPEIAGVSDAVFYRIRKEVIPNGALMKDAEWRARFLPTGQWEVPHINYTHVFDMSQADFFVWDGDPDHHPYRPQVIAVIDEHSQACLWAQYTEEVPSVATLAGCLLHAWLPKGDDWPMCGLPKYLHADNGKVQLSHWLEEVCGELGPAFGFVLSLRRAQVRSPWMDGHVESFYNILHHRLEPELAAYCGANHDSKPERFPDLKHPKRADFLTLEDANETLRIWITTDYHNELKHERLRMTRSRFWTIHAKGYVKLPDEGRLRTALMQRGPRKITRGRVQLMNQHYWHKRLQSYEGETLEVRWDGADLTKVLVMATHGDPFWAEREPTRRVDRLDDMKAVKQRRRTVKEERRLIQEASEILAGASDAEREAFLARAKAERAKKVIDFPQQPERIEPQEPEEISLRDLFPQSLGGDEIEDDSNGRSRPDLQVIDSQGTAP